MVRKKIDKPVEPVESEEMAEADEALALEQDGVAGDEMEELTAELDEAEDSDVVETVTVAAVPAPIAEADGDEPTITIRLNSDLRRRLKRSAQRQGVRPEEVAQLLLAQALMNPGGDPVDSLLVRVDKLEKRVAELATAQQVKPAAAAVERFAPPEDDRQDRRGGTAPWAGRRDDFGAGRNDRGDDRGGPRPPRGDFDRSRRPFGDRPAAPFADRPNRGFQERPSYGRPRDFEPRPPRRDVDDRAPRRNWDERPYRRDE